MTPVKRLAAGALAASTLVGFGAAIAPAAHADGLGGISGWQPTPTVCGKTNYVPVVVTNATNQTQTGSVTVPYGTATQIGLYTSGEDVYQSTLGANLVGECPNMTYQSPADAFSQNFTVAPGQTNVYWLLAGGLDENLIGDSHNIGFGGLPANTPGQSWYDLDLNLGITESFVSLNPNYTWTGGTNTDNNQNGFNLVKCDTDGGVFTTDQVLTPYAGNHTPNNVPWYFMNDPICAAWLPVGQMIPVSEANVEVGLASGATQGIIESINGLQLNATSPTYNVAGTFTSQAANAGTPTITLYNWTTGNPIDVSLNGSGSGTNAFWDESGWSLQNVAASPGDLLILNVTGGDGYGSYVTFMIPSSR